MLLFISTLGGLPMMGHQSRSESLFYYFRLEDQVPEDHLLRLIDRHVNFDFIRAKLKDSYSDTGRPSVAPNCCCACCWSAISTASRARGNWWKSCACIWRGAGSRDSASTRKFRTTLRFPRTGMDDFRNRICFKSFLRRSSSVASTPDW